MSASLRRMRANDGAAATGEPTGAVATVPAARAHSDSAFRARLLRKKAHCAGQASLTEVIVAVTILTFVVWGMVGFLMNGRVLVERTGQGIIAAQVAQEHLDRTRNLAYASIASGSGTETVGGLLYSWVLTVTNAQADPGDPNSTFKQTGVSVTWPTAPNANAQIFTGIVSGTIVPGNQNIAMMP